MSEPAQQHRIFDARHRLPDGEFGGGQILGRQAAGVLQIHDDSILKSAFCRDK
jgi:hypothetical protein